MWSAANGALTDLGASTVVGAALKDFDESVSRTYTGYFDGLLDELQIWNVARTAAALGNGHNLHNTLEGNEPGLLRYFHFNEGRGIIASDQTASTAANAFALLPLPSSSDGYGGTFTSFWSVSGAHVEDRVITKEDTAVVVR